MFLATNKLFHSGGHSLCYYLVSRCHSDDQTSPGGFFLCSVSTLSYYILHVSFMMEVNLSNTWKHNIEIFFYHLFMKTPRTCLHTFHRTSSHTSQPRCLSFLLISYANSSHIWEYRHLDSLNWRALDSEPYQDYELKELASRPHHIVSSRPTSSQCYQVDPAQQY